MQNQPMKTFSGNKNTYTEIATREPEVLGLSLIYDHHPVSGVGHLIARFACFSPKTILPKNFTRFSYREQTTFTREDGATVAGARLDRLVFPLFPQSVHRSQIQFFGDKMELWPILGSWLEEQLMADGFTPLVFNMPEFVRSLFAGESQEPKLLLELPDLAAVKQFKQQKQSGHNDYDA